MYHRFRILRIWVRCMKIAALDCLNPWFPALESANRIPAMANHTMAMANHTLPCLIDDGTVCQGRAVTGLLPVWAVMCVCVFGWMFVCLCVRVSFWLHAVYWVCIGLNSWGELCLVRYVCLCMNGCVSFECEEIWWILNDLMHLFLGCFYACLCHSWFSLIFGHHRTIQTCLGVCVCV